MRRLRLGRYVSRQVRHGRGRAATLGVGIVVAAVSFSLLTAAASTSEVRTRGAVEGSFRSAYDILVRPPGSRTELEESQGLVQNNFESGIFGGITEQQWREVLDAPGVEVAAPVAYLGYVTAQVKIPVALDPYVGDKRDQLFRLRTSWLANRGLSRYPGVRPYGFVTSRPNGCDGKIISSRAPVDAPDLYGPTGTYLECYERSRLGHVTDDSAKVTIVLDAFSVLLVAAIDPVQENALIGLDDAMVSGQPLTEDTSSEDMQTIRGYRPGQTSVIPVVAASSPFQDEPLRVRVQELRAPPRQTFAQLLDEPRGGEDIPAPNAAYRQAIRLSGTVVGGRTVPYRNLYGAVLDKLAGRPVPYRGGNQSSFTAYWAASPVSYRTGDDGVLVPQTVRNDGDRVWVDLGGGELSRDMSRLLPNVPPDNADVAYRRLSDPRQALYRAQRQIEGRFFAQGRFDPARLPGFDPLSQVPLEAYRPPLVEPADAASRAALGGQPLGPTGNLAGYISQPPALLTTLQAAEGMTAPRFFSGANHAAPISVIRVRVAGVTGPDEQSLERIRRAATVIQSRTGLDVDITAGSSPEPQLVSLPAGRFGQPPLLVSEGWTKKGVVVAILSAVDKKSALLFGLILIVTATFLANAALATVRARRRELGVLLTLGWESRHLFRVVLGELAVVGLLAGLVGAAVSGVLIRVLSLQLPLARVLLVPVVAVLLAVAAGLFPAALAAHGRPMDVVNPTVYHPRPSRWRGHRRARVRGGAAAGAGRLATLPRLAWVNLRRQRGRNIAAAGTLLLGVAALSSVIAITLAFQEAIVGTLLGQYVTTEVRGVDYLSVALTIALAGLSVADVLVLNVRERTSELVSLQAGGWTDVHLARLTLVEALGVGVAGAVPGAAVGLGLGELIGAPTVPTTIGAVAAAAVGIIVALSAAVLPARLATRSQIATALADE